MFWKTHPIRRLAVCFLAAFTALLVLTIMSLVGTSYYWDGGFGQVEHVLLFRDRAGKALEGVELRVTDGKGNPFLGYPISDYLPGSALLSDSEGQLVCHHVSLGPLEFGGRAKRLLWIVPVGEDVPPFRCHFFLQGREVGSCDYQELFVSTPDHAQVVVRQWDLERYVTEMKKVINSHKNVFFGEDRNRDEVISASERAAWNAFMAAYAQYQDRQRRQLPLIKDRLFPIVKKIIVLDTEKAVAVGDER